MQPRDALVIVNQLHGDLAPALVMAIIQQESNFDERAWRNDRNGGSYGLMQLDVPTARDRGFVGRPEELYLPATNIRLGVAQLEWIKPYLAPRGALGLQSLIAAYNEGVGNVIRGNPDPRYVGSVMGHYAAWRVQLGEGVH
jgi:soluble lytic murein transglycosylase-like protein